MAVGQSTSMLNDKWLSQASQLPQVMRYHKHETFVMELNGLRLNVAYFAGCGTFVDSAKMDCRTLSFT
jgi:hypothetical protein